MEEHQREPTSIKHILSDILTSLLLLGGAWVIEMVKQRFPDSTPPQTVLVILNISEITLMVYFAVAFMKAIVSLVKGFDQLMSSLSGASALWEHAFRSRKKENVLTKNVFLSTQEKVILLVASTVITVTLSLIIFVVSAIINYPQIGIVFFVVLIVATVVLGVSLKRRYSPLYAFAVDVSSGLSFGCGIGFFILFAMTVLWVSNMLDSNLGNNLATFVKGIYLDRTGLFVRISTGLVVTIVISIIISMIFERVMILFKEEE